MLIFLIGPEDGEPLTFLRIVPGVLPWREENSTNRTGLANWAERGNGGETKPLRPGFLCLSDSPPRQTGIGPVQAMFTPFLFRQGDPEYDWETVDVLPGRNAGPGG